MLQSSKRLDGRVALVTGSTSGIGLGIAEALASDGAHVVMNGLGSEADNREAIARVAGYGTKVAFDAANMLSPDEIAAMVKKAEDAHGRLDILVNNAGIQHVDPVDQFPIEKWNAVLSINLTAPFLAIRAAVPGMRARGFGRIINICSAHSLTASPNKSAYVSAKHGLAGLTKTVALELADKGVTCNAVSPGFVWTPLVERQIPDLARTQGLTIEEAKKQVLLRQPSGQFASTAEVGALVAFLATNEAGAITGSNYSIDGGWTAQ